MQLIRRLAVLAAAAALAASQAAAQGTGTVTGRVTSADNGAPLAGAQVSVSGGARRAVTNEQGEYRIADLAPGSYTLTASVLGRASASRTVAVAAGQTATAHFALGAQAIALDQLVVTATGEPARRRELGNAVSTVNPDAVDLAPVQTTSQLIQGRAPGVVVATPGGSVGAGAKIRIRGNSSVSLDATPLLIVDGVRVNNFTGETGLFTGGQKTSRWDDLNPEEIENIEILRGPAAAALYGTAAANGVVQVTTKRGRAGRTRLRVYTGQATSAIPTGEIPTNYRARGIRTVNGVQTFGDCDLVARAAGICTRVDSLYAYNPLVDAPNTPLGSSNVTTLGGTLSGGAPNGDITYFLAAENEAGDGLLRFNDLKRTNVRANVAAQAARNLRVTASTGFVTSYIQLPQADNSGNSATTTALQGDPSPGNVQRGQGFRFPYSAESVGAWKNYEDLRRFTGSLQADWQPLEALRVNGALGLDQANRFERSLIQRPGLATGFLATGLREQFRTQSREVSATLNASLRGSLGSRFSYLTTGGVQYNASDYDWTYASGVDLAPGTYQPATPSDVAEFTGPGKLFGMLFSQQVGLNDRLFLTVAVRGDQNSAFGERIGFITYPAFSASWVLAEEPWFPQVSALSNLRVRASYGESGQRPGRLDAVRTYADQSAVIGGSTIPGVVLDNLGNPDLKPEVSQEFEFGADLGLFDDRVQIEATRYDKTTRDALVERPLPYSLGGPTTQFYNLGRVHNSGWEIAANLNAVRSENADVNLRAQLSTNRNRLVDLGEGIPPITGFGTLQRHIEDHPLAGYWGARYRYSDANGDGLIQVAEVEALEEQDDPETETSYLGSSSPTRQLSLAADATLFRVFRVSTLFDHKGGHKLFNWTRYSRCSDTNNAFCDDRQVPGAATLEEQAAIQARRAGITAAGFLEDAAFWKWRELALTVTAPERWARRLPGASGLSFTLAGRNLATWTRYTGMDPETNESGSAGDAADPAAFNAADYFGVPQPRSFVFRFDLNF